MIASITSKTGLLIRNGLRHEQVRGTLMSTIKPGPCESCSHRGLCTSRVELFANLPEVLQYELAQGVKHFNLNKGDVLIAAQTPCRSILIVRYGKLKLHTYDADGKEFILDIYVDGDSIGDELFLTRSLYPYEVVALTDVGICEITTDQFQALITREPQTTLNLISALATKLDRANKKNAMLSENDALVRLARFLIDRHKRTHGNIELTIDDIAASVNLRRETVSRKIGELQDRGFLRRVGQSSLELLIAEDALEGFLETLI